MTTEEDSASLAHPEWKLYIDGASGSHSSEAGIILVGPNKVQIKYAVKLKYNAAEYKALLTGLKLAIKVRAEHLKVYSDSQLVVN